MKEASRGRNPSCQGSGALPSRLHCSALWSKLPRLRCSHNTPLPRVAPSEQVLFSEKPIIFLEAAANLFTYRCNLGCSMNSVHISPVIVNNLHINLIIVAFIRFCALSHLSLLSSAFGNPGLVSWRGKDQEAILAYDMSLRAPRYKVGRYQI